MTDLQCSHCSGAERREIRRMHGWVASYWRRQGATWLLRVGLALVLLLLPIRAAESAATPTELGRPQVRSFPAPYGASPQFWSAAQDAAGNWFFGNQPGVVSFDGATWRRIAGERYSAVTRAVALGPDGRIYVGSRGDLGWLRPRSDGGHDWVSLFDQLSEADRDFQEVYQIVAHRDAVYFMAAKKLLIWRQGKFTALPHALGRLESVGETLYLQSANAPLGRVEDGRAVAVSSAPVFLGDAVRHLAALPDGRLLVVTVKSGLHHCDPATGAVTPWPTEMDDLLNSKQVYRARRLADGAIAIAFAATGGGGLGVVDANGRFRHYLDEPGGLPSSVVYGLETDRQGGLWLCLDYGLAHLQMPAAQTLFDRARGLDRAVSTSFVRHAGVLYQGTTQGLYRLVPGRAPQTNARFEREAQVAGGVYALHANGDDLFVVGDQRVFQRTAAGFSQIVQLPELGYAIAQRKGEHALWVGTSTGLRLLVLTDGTWRDLGLIKGIEGTVRGLCHIARAEGEELWAAVNGRGFYRLQLPPVAHGPPELGALQPEFVAAAGQVRVTEWQGEPCFLVQSEQRPLRFEPAQRKLVPWPGLPAMPDGVTINAVAFGREGGDLWTASFVRDGVGRGRGGVFRFSMGGVSGPLPHAEFDAIEGPLQFFAESVEGRRTLWLSGAGGTARLEVDAPVAAPAPFVVQLYGGPTRHGETLPYARNAPTFEFVAARIQAMEPLEYRSRLDGFEAAWSPWKPDRRRSFTNLHEGAYRFEVQARDGDGVTSPPATLAFAILPPWWRTWWAYAGYGAAGLAALFGFARLRTAALRQRNAELEQTVQARTVDLAEKNRELTRLHRLELDEKITARLAAEASRLETLRYQLNPHFLLNTLTAVRSQIAAGEPQSEATVERLADFCRLTLGSRAPGEFSTVGAELEILQAYLEIEQTRLGDGLEVTWELDPAAAELPLPRSLLLPLVENALKYGLATSEDRLGLRLVTRLEGAVLTIEVANTGRWVESGSRPDLPSLGIGHSNVRERLERHYPGAHVFSHSAADGWVWVSLRLRLKAEG